MTPREDLRDGRVYHVNTADAHERSNADREKTTVLTTRSAVGDHVSMIEYNPAAVSCFGSTASQSVTTLRGAR